MHAGALETFNAVLLAKEAVAGGRDDPRRGSIRTSRAGTSCPRSRSAGRKCERTEALDDGLATSASLGQRCA